MRYGYSSSVLSLEPNSMLKRIIEKEERKAARLIFRDYCPTIIALGNSEEGLTAEKASELTGRPIETEAVYLRRFENAGVAGKKGETYFLKDLQMIRRIWGDKALKEIEKQIKCKS